MASIVRLNCRNNVPLRPVGLMTVQAGVHLLNTARARPGTGASLSGAVP